jgi:hypothetical protein
MPAVNPSEVGRFASRHAYLKVAGANAKLRSRWNLADLPNFQDLTVPEYEKGQFVVLLRDGSSFNIESDDWRYDEKAKAFRFFDIDETPEGPKNHEVAWLAECEVRGVVEAERISKRRDLISRQSEPAEPPAGAARRKPGARETS